MPRSIIQHGRSKTINHLERLGCRSKNLTVWKSLYFGGWKWCKTSPDSKENSLCTKGYHQSSIADLFFSELSFLFAKVRERRKATAKTGNHHYNVGEINACGLTIAFFPGIQTGVLSSPFVQCGSLALTKRTAGKAKHTIGRVPLKNISPPLKKRQMCNLIGAPIHILSLPLSLYLYYAHTQSLFSLFIRG